MKILCRIIRRCLNSILQPYEVESVMSTTDKSTKSRTGKLLGELREMVSVASLATTVENNDLAEISKRAREVFDKRREIAEEVLAEERQSVVSSVEGMLENLPEEEILSRVVYQLRTLLISLLRD